MDYEIGQFYLTRSGCLRYAITDCYLITLEHPISHYKVTLATPRTSLLGSQILKKVDKPIKREVLKFMNSETFLPNRLNMTITQLYINMYLTIKNKKDAH